MSTVEEKPYYWTPLEAADHLRRTRPTIYRWFREGKFTPHDLGGGRVGLVRTEVEAMAQRRKAKESGPTAPLPRSIEHQPPIKNVGSPMGPINGVAFVQAETLGTSHQLRISSEGHLGGGLYGSKLMIFFIVLTDVGAPGTLNEAELAAGLDKWLPTQGINGCWLHATTGRVNIMWSVSLGLQPEKLRRALNKLRKMMTDE
jgi:predicted DNA-binding transcriptional regulator AlpA